MRVLPAPLDDGYDVRGAQTARVERESALADVPVFHRSTGKACASIDRPVIWQVPACFGVPPHLIAAIRQIHDGMKACVRNDNGVCSDWFEVAQGLRQGCMLSPLLSNVLVAARLLVALLIERFSENVGILADLAHFQD